MSGTRTRSLPTRTKIVATLGPATRKPAQVRALVRAGVDVFRINFSHGRADEHRRAIRCVRRAAKLEGRPAALLADLQGPKIRVAAVRGDEPLRLARGDRLTIVADPSILGEPGRIGCTYPGLPRDVAPGDRILLDDGSIELRVEAVQGAEVQTRVRYPGLLRSHGGLNLPGVAVRAPSLGKKDLADLAVALAAGADYIALSFVRSAADVTKLVRRIAKAGADAEVIAKIERPEAVRDLEAIVRAAGGVMVARGDMGVELGPEAVPGIQKRVIRLCIEAAKPVITATEMLETMVRSPRPTRAEVSDVANAIHDGTSAVMLSAETAAGRYPVLAVKMMDRIARRTEAEIFAARWIPDPPRTTAGPASSARSHGPDGRPSSSPASACRFGWSRSPRRPGPSRSSACTGGSCRGSRAGSGRSRPCTVRPSATSWRPGRGGPATGSSSSPDRSRSPARPTRSRFASCPDLDRSAAAA